MDGFEQGFAFKQFILGLVVVVVAALYRGAALVDNVAAAFFFYYQERLALVDGTGVEGYYGGDYYHAQPDAEGYPAAAEEEV